MMMNNPGPSAAGPMARSKLYEQPEQELIAASMYALKIPVVILAVVGLLSDKPSEQAKAWLVCAALEALSKGYEIVVLSSTSSLPEDRQHLIELKLNQNDRGAIVAYGPDRLQAVLRAVLIVKGISL